MEKGYSRNIPYFVLDRNLNVNGRESKRIEKENDLFDLFDFWTFPLRRISKKDELFFLD